MGRSFDGDGEEIPYGLWMGAFRQAVRGKRGQAFLRETEAALLAMQAAGNARLIEGALIATTEPEVPPEKKAEFASDSSPACNWAHYREERWKRENAVPDATQVCTLGAVALARGIPESRVAQVEPENIWESAAFGEDVLKVARVLAWEMARENDEAKGHHVTEATPYGERRYWVPGKETPEERFIRMLSWIQSLIIRPEVPTP